MVDDWKEATVTETTQVKVLEMAWDTVADAFLFNLAELSSMQDRFLLRRDYC